MAAHKEGWEEGRVRGPYAHFVSWIQLDNTYISINNPGNNQKLAEKNFTTKGRERKKLYNFGHIKKNRKDRDAVENETDRSGPQREEGSCRCGEGRETDFYTGELHMGKRNPHDIWL